MTFRPAVSPALPLAVLSFVFALPASAAAPTACDRPAFVTSDPNGGWYDGRYYVHNNMWNHEAHLGPETLSACSHRFWWVVSNQTNEAGAVKTYPNVHVDYPDVPIASFTRLRSTFAATSPHVGIYDVAYDLWINGVATPGCTELMIWTENFHQVPADRLELTVTFGGRRYDVWTGRDHHYIALVPKRPMTEGRLDLLEMLRWITGRGWIPATSTLGSICYGVEIVETGGGPATFRFTDFSITETRRPGGGKPAPSPR